MEEKISVILPAYRELENLRILIPAISVAMQGKDFEILVVDDDSRDGTRDFLEGYAGPNLRYWIREGVRGFASAIAEGIRRSEGSILIIMDSDFNHDPAELKRMIDGLAGADFVSGSRFLKGSRSDYRLRTRLSGFFNGFIRRRLRSRRTDYLFGFCAFRKSVLNGIQASDVFHGAGEYYMRLLHVLEKKGAKIVEVPAYHRRRHSGAGNRKFFRTAWIYFKSVMDLPSA